LALLVENFIPITTVLLRRKALQEIIPLRTDLSFLDWYMNLQIARRHELYYLAETLAEYRIHGKNQHTQLQRLPAFDDTVLRILDEMFESPERADETQKIRSRVYASTYLGLGDRAFAMDRMDDARGYYLSALRYHYRMAAHPGLIRHLLGTLLGSARYNRAKAFFRGATF
jgi:hypothetical protein